VKQKKLPNMGPRTEIKNVEVKNPERKGSAGVVVADMFVNLSIEENNPI